MSIRGLHTRLRPVGAVGLCVLLLLGAAGAPPFHAISAHAKSLQPSVEDGAPPGLHAGSACAHRTHADSGCGLCFLAAQSGVALCPASSSTLIAAPCDARIAAGFAAPPAALRGPFAARAPPCVC
jgi:hypothetical protein